MLRAEIRKVSIQSFWRGELKLTTNTPRHPLEICHTITKDALIEEQNANLRPSKVESVEDLSDNKPFGHHDDVRGIQQVGMNAHSAAMHGEDEANNDEVPALQNVSDATRVTSGLYSTYHRENDHIIIPPKRLSFDATAYQPQSDRDQGQNCHRYHDRYRPWLDVVWIESRQTRKLRLRHILAA
jgi:hypothetical protein